MACDIRIISVTGRRNPTGSFLERITIRGIASECEKIDVSVQCAAIDRNLTAGVNDLGRWMVEINTTPSTFDHGCRCGSTVHITAECHGKPDCGDIFEGTLICGEMPGCPAVGVRKVIGDCNADGTRNVIFYSDFSFATGPIAAEWDFGDGSTGVAYSLSSPGTHTETHTYARTGVYPARLNIILPSGCPSIEIPVVLEDPCTCPEVTDLRSEIIDDGECVGEGRTVRIRFTGTLSPPATGCRFIWDFGDGSPDLETDILEATHEYSEPGTKPVSVLAICGSGCSRISNTTIDISPCCPVIVGITSTIEPCREGQKTPIAIFHADIHPSTAIGNFQWDFGDGMTETSTAADITHHYLSSSPPRYRVRVTFTPEDHSCPETGADIDVEVPRCTNGGDSDDECSGCWILRTIVVFLAIFAAIAGYIALCVPAAASWIAYVSAGLAGVALILGIVWYFFCPKPCGWALLLTWQISLGAGIVALYFAICCPWLWWVGIGLILLGIPLLFGWKRRCHRSWCDVTRELIVVVVGSIVPMIGWLSTIPALKACIDARVGAVVGTIAGILALKLAKCPNP